MNPTSRFNSIYVGLIIGFIAPIITSYGFYLYNFKFYGFLIFLKKLEQMNSISGLISLCAISNLLIFFAFIQLNLIYSARGVVFSTVFYAFVVVIFKFII